MADELRETGAMWDYDVSTTCRLDPIIVISASPGDRSVHDLIPFTMRYGIQSVSISGELISTEIEEAYRSDAYIVLISPRIDIASVLVYHRLFERRYNPNQIVIFRNSRECLRASKSLLDNNCFGRVLSIHNCDTSNMADFLRGAMSAKQMEYRYADAQARYAVAR